MFQSFRGAHAPPRQIRGRHSQSQQPTDEQQSDVQQTDDEEVHGRGRGGPPSEEALPAIRDVPRAQDHHEELRDRGGHGGNGPLNVIVESERVTKKWPWGGKELEI